jgi:putative nucleotidyltransferase with HDIG domain
MGPLDKFIDQVKTLPPAPRILTELLVLLGKEDVDCSQVVELITFDPALTAQVLQRCNSAAAGLAQPVSDLPEAVMRIGFREVYCLVAAVVSESSLGAAQRGYGIGPGELWQHSAVTAIAGRVLARALQGEENLVFTAALLHDIGKLVLSASLEGAMAAVVEETERSGRSFLEAEKSILGVEHAEIGGRLLQRWNFPENLVQAVWQHHDPLKAHPHEWLAACVHVGDMLAHLLGCGHGYQAHAVHTRGEALAVLKITPRDIETFLLQTEAALSETRWYTRKDV